MGNNDRHFGDQVNSTKVLRTKEILVKVGLFVENKDILSNFFFTFWLLFFALISGFCFSSQFLVLPFFFSFLIFFVFVFFVFIFCSILLLLLLLLFSFFVCFFFLKKRQHFKNITRSK